MSKLSHRVSDIFSKYFIPPKLRSRKDGSLECPLHPLSDLKDNGGYFYCVECYKAKPKKRDFIMSRTRPARKQ